MIILCRGRPPDTTHFEKHLLTATFRTTLEWINNGPPMVQSRREKRVILFNFFKMYLFLSCWTDCICNLFMLFSQYLQFEQVLQLVPGLVSVTNNERKIYHLITVTLCEFHQILKLQNYSITWSTSLNMLNSLKIGDLFSYFLLRIGFQTFVTRFL